MKNKFIVAMSMLTVSIFFIVSSSIASLAVNAVDDTIDNITPEAYEYTYTYLSGDTCFVHIDTPVVLTDEKYELYKQVCESLGYEPPSKEDFYNGDYTDSIEE